MSNPIELAKELKAEIDKEPVVIEYKRIKSLIDCNEELQELKRQIALAKAHKDNDLHKSLLAKYNNHPLIINYQVLKEEVSGLLQEISNIVNKK